MSSSQMSLVGSKCGMLCSLSLSCLNFTLSCFPGTTPHPGSSRRVLLSGASPPRPSSAHSDSRSDACISSARCTDAAAPSPPRVPPQPDTPRLRASTANIIEQAALSGIEDLDAAQQAEERISAVLKRAQSAASPGKRRGVTAGEEAAPKAAAQASHKSHMLPYLQRCERVAPALAFC